MKALPILAFGVAALLANLVTRGNAEPSTSVTSNPAAIATSVAVAADEHPDDCKGGEDDLVTVALEPDEIVAGRGGERLGIGVHVHPHFDGAAALVGAAEIIDDRGRRIGAAQALDRRTLPARSAASYRVATPDALRDGYYRVQVSVLARSDADRSEDYSTHQLYIHVAGGAVTPISVDEWLTRSQAGLVFTSR